MVNSVQTLINTKIEEGVNALLDLLDDYTNIPEKVKNIKDLEHEADEITHQTIDKLNYYRLEGGRFVDSSI